MPTNNTKSSIHIAVYTTTDGGFGWFVVAAAFAISFLVEGSILSFSVYTQAWITTLGVNDVTFISSTQLAAYFMSGPLSAVLLNMCGFRLTTVFGTVLACCGYLCASFTNSYTWTLLSYGVLAGLGSGIVYLPTIIIVSHYFERYRVIANGIMLCGSSIGSIAVSSILTIAVQRWGKENALRLQACMLAMVFVFAMVYKPPPMRVVSATEDKQSGNISELHSRKRSVTVEDALSLDSYKSSGLICVCLLSQMCRLIFSTFHR